MRVLACALVLVAATGVARADDDDYDVDGEFVGVPKLSVALSLGGHGTRIGGQSETGFGSSLEFALGRKRWQYFIEGSIGTARLATSTADPTASIGGRLASYGLGARWIARQFRPGSAGGVEMFLLSRAGMQRYYFVDGTRLGRPELAFGFGIQGRVYRRPRIGFRFDARVLFTPNDSESSLVACSGRCMNEMGSSTGFSSGIGFVW